MNPRRQHNDPVLHVATILVTLAAVGVLIGALGKQPYSYFQILRWLTTGAVALLIWRGAGSSGDTIPNYNDPSDGKVHSLAMPPIRGRIYEDSFALTSRFRLISSSAAWTASLRCTSGGTRTMNFPLYRREVIGAGTRSPPAFMSFTTSDTVLCMPRSASSGVGASQLKLGNSAHSPTHWESSSDQTTRYV